MAPVGDFLDLSFKGDLFFRKNSPASETMGSLSQYDFYHFCDISNDAYLNGRRMYINASPAKVGFFRCFASDSSMG